MKCTKNQLEMLKGSPTDSVIIATEFQEVGYKKRMFYREETGWKSRTVYRLQVFYVTFSDQLL